jgi:hypothetical protein
MEDRLTEFGRRREQQKMTKSGTGGAFETRMLPKTVLPSD